MPATVTLINLTNRPVLARGNSGTTFHLPPNGKIENVHEVEVNNNERIKKLEDGRMIKTVREATGEKTTLAAPDDVEKEKAVTVMVDAGKEKKSHDAVEAAKTERGKAESAAKHKK